MSKPRRLQPTITFRGRGNASLLNRTAHELLRQDGERFVVVRRRGSEITIEPLPITKGGEVLSVGRMTPRDNGGALVNISDVGATGERFEVAWDDSRGVLVVDTARPVQSGRKALA